MDLYRRFKKKMTFKQYLMVFGGSALAVLGYYLLSKYFPNKKIRDRCRLRLFSLLKKEAEVRSALIKNTKYTLFLQLNFEMNMSKLLLF